MPFTSIHTEGGLIPADLIEEIAAGDAPGQASADFGLPPNARITDDIAGVWADARAYWNAFQRARARLPDDDPATTVTREQWVLPLLLSLGYSQATYMPAAETVEGRTYAISHRAGPDESAPPIHIQGCGVRLDQRPPSGRPRLSAHALVQEYLNHTEHLWGVVTNGLHLRLVRDSALMTRISYVEFDLETMLNGEHFADFGAFYRLLHRTRLPRTIDDADECLLEKYYQQALEQGGRVRERLRDGVEDALRILGNGFLAHPASADLREKLRAGTMTPLDYYRQLLRLVYRFLFLLASEERGLIGPEDPARARIYHEHYSLSRLRPLTETALSTAERYHDLWEGVKVTFQIHEHQDIAARLGMGALDSDLFGPHAIPDLMGAAIYNRELLRALRRLMLYRDGRVTRRVNYGALDVEELGSVYESLLDYYPDVQPTPHGMEFALLAGTERKTTGSYYTRPELVHELIKSALEPVMQARLDAAGPDPAAREAALLNLTVCDPACGSGHFLLAAARRIGGELARVRTGEHHPPPEVVRPAVRDVIRRCIYGVDKNPLAVDLCKVALWLEGHNRGMPLTFLDHRIKCGDSLVGVFDLHVLIDGIPDGAYKPVSGDDKKIARSLRDRNREERAGQLGLFGPAETPDTRALADLWRGLSATPDDSPDTVHAKERAYEQIRAGGDWWTLHTACNLWTAAFFTPLTPANAERAPTTTTVRDYLAHPQAAHGQQVAEAHRMANEGRWFHWPLEFPDVFAAGGFDVVLGNPPWERIKLQEQEFFAGHDPAIAAAPNKAARQRLIDALPKTKPALARAFEEAKHAADAASRFVRLGERFPLSAVGDVNTYALFAELARTLLNGAGRAGIIVPTGIATDSTTKDFFGDLVDSQSLVRLIGFENEAFIFPDVHHAFKFCTLTIAGGKAKVARADFAFFCRYFDQVQQPERHFELSSDDFRLINPNTRTCPVFRTRADAELTRRIYARVPVLVNEATGETPWGVRFSTMFHMSSDSILFRATPGDGLLPLYEAKMLWQFDHRFGDYRDYPEDISTTHLPDVPVSRLQDPDYRVAPRYWVATDEVNARLREWRRNWLLGFRDITNATNERTAIFSLLPRVGVGNKIPLLLPEVNDACHVVCLLASFNSLPFDYVARQKIGGTTLNFFIVKQFPVLPPDRYAPADIDFIASRVLELVYTAWDMQPFAQDMGYDGPPFIWDEARRALLRAELDAYYAHLYGLTRDELRYILDPADVYGPDFPGETFRVLKEKEIRQHGEYRTRRLVLEAWDRMFG